MDNAAETCANCRYFVPQETVTINMPGHPNDGQLWVTQRQECRRFPKRVSKVSYDWCGEFTAIREGG